ncbi:MAG: very short patch repair endonuclease [Planctomycetes bacterium GWF2_50_10]|nr:MAG: very short patch repair endonuclease [Planctomycetes bacterium GWF2_50_10]
MSLVKGKGTKPELAVRRVTYALGYRYRLHKRELPGRPDLVFARLKKVIFVHGCFWHRHSGCPRCRLPKTRKHFWGMKLEGNRLRDLKNQRLLREQGWSFLLIWECQTEDATVLEGIIRSFLEDGT